MNLDSGPAESATDDWRKITRLGTLECTSRRCDQNLHAFRRRASKGLSYRNGSCIGCDFDDIDWNRLDKRNIGDSDYTFKALNYEMIRNYYWGNNIENNVVAKANLMGLEAIRIRAEACLEKVIRPPQRELFRDGYLTPWGGNIIHYAQHGTATCCRRCVEEWHGIHRNTRLSRADLDYFTELILVYTRTRLPSITVNGQTARL